MSAAPLAWRAVWEERGRAAAAAPAKPVLKPTLRTSLGRVLLPVGYMVPEPSGETPTALGNVVLFRTSDPAAMGPLEPAEERCREGGNEQRLRRQRQGIGTDNNRIWAGHEGWGWVLVGLGTGRMLVQVDMLRNLTRRAEEVGAGTDWVVRKVPAMLEGGLVVLRRGEVVMVGHRLRSTRQRARTTFWRVWG